MNARLNTSFAVAGTALILLTGCVSSKKYKASQAELSRVKGDSAQLAQQVASLNGNVHDLQDRNTAIQRSLDSTSNNYAVQQKSLDYYQGYFKQQQDTLTAVSEDVKSALTQAGISNGDVQQSNNVIYVRVDENELFKKNSMVMSPTGKKVLNGLTGVINGRPNIDVAVGAGDSAVAYVSAENMPGNAGMSDAPRRHRVHHAHHSAAAAGTASGSGNGGVAANASGAASKSDAAPTHRKVHHKYSSEGSVAVYRGPGRSHAWALKQGRMVVVANHFLNNGVPKMNVTLQHPPMNGAPNNDIKIVITPKMDKLAPQVSSSAAVGAR